MSLRLNRSELKWAFTLQKMYKLVWKLWERVYCIPCQFYGKESTKSLPSWNELGEFIHNGTICR